MNNKTKILSFDEGVHCLRAGGLVIYPTETFFAVGCALGAMVALERLYEVKNRPRLRPIPVLAANMPQVESVAELTEIERQLAKQFWPGPLTLISEAKQVVPSIVSANTGKVAVRISSHPLALALAQDVGDVLVCSSANISGEEPVTDYEQLPTDFINQTDGIILGEPKPQGLLASTLVQVLGDNKLCIRRHGAVSEAVLREHGWHIEN